MSTEEKEPEKKCVNITEPIEMEPISSFDPTRLVMLPDGLCLEVGNVLGYLDSFDGNLPGSLSVTDETNEYWLWKNSISLRNFLLKLEEIDSLTNEEKDLPQKIFTGFQERELSARMIKWVRYLENKYEIFTRLYILTLATDETYSTHPSFIVLIDEFNGSLHHYGSPPICKKKSEFVENIKENFATDRADRMLKQFEHFKDNLPEEVCISMFSPAQKIASLFLYLMGILRKVGFSDDEVFRLTNYDNGIKQGNGCIATLGKYLNRGIVKLHLDRVIDLGSYYPDELSHEEKKSLISIFVTIVEDALFELDDLEVLKALVEELDE